MVPGSLPSGPLLQIGRARLAAIERPYTVLLSAPAQVASKAATPQLPWTGCVECRLCGKGAAADRQNRP